MSKQKQPQPNWPSKVPGKPSGPGRDNYPPSKPAPPPPPSKPISPPPPKK
jgi:hypothetical protein